MNLIHKKPNKISIYILIIFAVFGCKNASISSAKNGLIINDSLRTFEQIELIYENAKFFPDKTQLSLAFIDNNDVSFYGIKRLRDTLFFVNNSDKIFEIGSLTKTFTTTLLAGYAIAGEIKIEEKINDYLQFRIKDNIPITFKGLANHTSGLPREPSNMLWCAILNPDDPFKTYDEEKLKEYLMQKISKPDNSPRRFQYSNLGAGILGYVLCQTKGTTYENLLQKHIFAKYKMKSSTTQLKKVNQNIVNGLDENGNESPNWIWDSSSLVSAGGILSNAEDLSKFISAQFDNKNSELKLTQKMTFADSLSGVKKMKGIGLGWIILEGIDSNNWHWHNGGTYGYKASAVFDVKKKKGIVILSNVSAKNERNGNIDQLSFELLKTLCNDYY